jgi:hypothetical protein
MPQNLEQVPHRSLGGLLEELTEAACCTDRVEGLTHGYYRYPARFSPEFARTAVRLFSKPGQLVMDPYMGGGTTVVEAMSLGRPVVGNDLNSLAVFIAKVKTTLLDESECRAVEQWCEGVIARLTYRAPLCELEHCYDERKTKNLTHIRARFIKKAIAVALVSLPELPTANAQDFARCVVLKVSQWALDGRSRHTSLAEFRSKLSATTREMLAGMRALSACCSGQGRPSVHLCNEDAENVACLPCFASAGNRVSLVVTSPPYPGVHVLYHRWQVDGRRETPAPYWIAGCNDGQGASFYNFGDRRESGIETYFASSLRTLKGIRRVMAGNGLMVQMVAFNNPAEQLPRYLQNMESAGFREITPSESGAASRANRIWREVPNRKWHAILNGKTHSSREVVLIHAAV